MFLSGSQCRFASASYLFHGRFDRNGVLDRIFNAFDTADRVRMSLAYALAPECISASLNQDGFCIQTVQREHTRIPADRDNADVSAFLCSLIYACKIFRDSCVCIETVDRVERSSNFWSDDRQIGSRTAAEDHNIDLIFHSFHIIEMLYNSTFSLNRNTGRISSCENCFQFHIIIAFDGLLNAASNVAIANNTNSDFFHFLTSPVKNFLLSIIGFQLWEPCELF